ncbi:uncharacterized protein [Branchiostoma lanceolatum]|uniref:uncharacterized protein n=1 Tax=Branchiostoma lanceolatum TaxID=7740 RepID=UPI003452C735
MQIGTRHALQGVAPNDPWPRDGSTYSSPIVAAIPVRAPSPKTPRHSSTLATMRVLNFVLLFGLLATTLSKDVVKVNKGLAKNDDVKWTKIIGQVHKIIRKLPRDLQLPATKLVFQLPKLFENLLKSKDSYLQNPAEMLKMIGFGLMETWTFVLNNLSEEVKGDVMKVLRGMSDLARLKNEMSNIRGKLPQFQDINLQTDVPEALNKIQKDVPKLWKNIQKKLPKTLSTDYKSLLKHLPDEKQVRQIVYSLLTILDEKLPSLASYDTTNIASHLKDFEKHVPEASREIVTAAFQALTTFQEKFPDLSNLTVTGKMIRVHVPVLVRQAVDNFPDLKSATIDVKRLESELHNLLAQVKNGLPGLMQSLSAKFPDLSQWKPESLPDVFLEVARWIGDLLVGGPARLPDMSQLSKEQGGMMKTLFASAGTKLKFIAHNITQHLSDGIQYVKENLPEQNPDRNEL